MCRKNFCDKMLLVIKLNIYFELGDLKFVWDSEKAEKNYKKHKIRFENATHVFFDDFKIDEFDEIHSDDEDRYKIIGKVGKILVVIYTERGDFIRIISARYADRDEEVEYYEQFY